METTKSSKALDWILFLVFAVIMILMLIFMNEWFWIAMPFVFTYLAKALDVM